ncbi:MAG: ATP-binding cassette domain-containing protein, partial [Haloarculaceae archaeon]
MAAIELEGLSKDYGEVVAADDLTFAVPEGETFGFLGPNGAGKTTTIRMLLGLINPTAGTARVLGTSIEDRRALIETKRRVGFLPDEPAFDEQATGAAIL